MFTASSLEIASGDISASQLSAFCGKVADQALYTITLGKPPRAAAAEAMWDFRVVLVAKSAVMWWWLEGVEEVLGGERERVATV